MKFYMLMLMNAWMMIVLMKCKCQIQCLTLGCYTIAFNILDIFVSIFFNSFFLFFMNNFYIAPCLFLATKLLRDSNKNLEHLFGG